MASPEIGQRPFCAVFYGATNFGHEIAADPVFRGLPGVGPRSRGFLGPPSAPVAIFIAKHFVRRGPPSHNAISRIYRGEGFLKRVTETAIPMERY